MMLYCDCDSCVWWSVTKMDGLLILCFTIPCRYNCRLVVSWCDFVWTDCWYSTLQCRASSGKHVDSTRFHHWWCLLHSVWFALVVSFLLFIILNVLNLYKPLHFFCVLLCWIMVPKDKLIALSLRIFSLVLWGLE